jgi:hypothetical protein
MDQELKEHELICNTGTAINRMKSEVETLNEMIEDYKTYTNNALFFTQLKNLKQRMLTELKAIDKNFNEYVDYNESLNH